MIDLLSKALGLKRTCDFLPSGRVGQPQQSQWAFPKPPLANTGSQQASLPVCSAPNPPNLSLSPFKRRRDEV